MSMLRSSARCAASCSVRSIRGPGVANGAAAGGGTGWSCCVACSMRARTRAGSIAAVSRGFSWAAADPAARAATATAAVTNVFLFTSASTLGIGREGPLAHAIGAAARCFTLVVHRLGLHPLLGSEHAVHAIEHQGTRLVGVGASIFNLLDLRDHRGLVRGVENHPGELFLELVEPLARLAQLWNGLLPDLFDRGGLLLADAQLAAHRLVHPPLRRRLPSLAVGPATVTAASAGLLGRLPV